jgi:hypothetical protein
MACRVVAFAQPRCFEWVAPLFVDTEIGCFMALEAGRVESEDLPGTA